MTESIRPAGTTEDISLRTIVVFALWGALAGALLELAARSVLFATRPALDSSFHLFPMAIVVGPLVNLPVSALAVLLAWGVGRAFKPARTLAALAFAVVGLAVFEVALITYRVHVASLAVFAMGCGALAARLATRSPTATLRFLNASTVGMLLIAAVGGVAIVARQSWAERRAMAALAEPPVGAPNVVVLILDTVRAIELGAYGYERPVSPNIDRLASSGVQFDQAYSTAPWTLPSHATMLSGRYPHELSTGWSEPFNGEVPLVTELLRDKGYATGAFVGNTTYLSRRWGLNVGFVRYEDFQLDATALWSTSTLTGFLVKLVNTSTSHRIMVNGTRADLVRERFAAWQAGLGGRPFFAFLNFFDAHAPYGAPAPFDTLFLGRRPRAYDIDNWSQRGAEENNELRAGYDQAIAWLDSQIGALIDGLRERGLLNQTYIIVTSDHGEDFGEHGFSGHGSSLHTTQTRVPLLVIPPGHAGNVRIAEYVTLRDLAATIADVTGLDRSALPGTSLATYWTSGDGPADSSAVRSHSPILSEVIGRPTWKPWYPAAHGRMNNIRAGGWSYTLQEGGVEQLFDLATDPLELNDLSRVAAHADRLQPLRDALQAALAGNGAGVRR